MKHILSCVICILCSAVSALILLSCATAKSGYDSYRPPKTAEEESEITIKEPGIEPEASELKIPEFIPFKEDISPIQTKIVSISARNTPLRDVLYTIAETVNLNIVMERGVNPELPITLTLNNLPVQDALNIIFNSVDYFYSIKENVLLIKAEETKIFEIGRPGVVQNYRVDLGGDILGGTATEGGGGEIKGDVSLQSASDKGAFQFWDALENSLNKILQVSATGKDIPQGSFTVNRMAGTIMVTASKKTLVRVENYIENLKRVLNRQVLIETRIVEIQLSEGLQYGINWELIDQWKGVGEIDIAAAKFTSAVSSTKPSFQIKITGQDFTSLLLALQEQGNIKTLSKPRVSVLNGQTAMLTVGRNTSFISRVETTTTAEAGASVISFSVETKSVLSGIMFGLVPYISEEEDITLTITPIISNLVELTPALVGDDDSSIEIQLPTVDLREMSSTVKLSDGEMVVIGGLIDKKEKLKENRVPILSDIPVLGNIFKSVDKSFEKNELLIMLVPRILND